MFSPVFQSRGETLPYRDHWSVSTGGVGLTERIWREETRGDGKTGQEKRGMEKRWEGRR